MRPLHVYHADGDAIRALIHRAAPERRVTVWDRAEAFRAEISAAEYLLTSAPPGDCWARAAQLRLIQVTGAGVDGVLPAAGLSPAVQLAGARGLFAVEAAEHAVAMMLALCRGLPALVHRQAARRWQPFAAGTLAGKRLGLVGLGEIGRRIATRAHALEMTVTGVCREPRPVDGVARVVGPAQLDDVARAADYLVVTVPRTPATVGLVDRRVLALLPEGATVVHLSRGGVVDEAALLAALADGRVGAAAVDVFADEPLPADSAWWTAPNALVTPHVAGRGRQYLERVTARFLENVRRVDAGQPPYGAVDPRRGY